MSRLDQGHFVPYDKLAATLDKYRKASPGKLTLAEKILYAHLDNPTQKITRGKTYLNLRPDRVAMQVRLPSLPRACRANVHSRTAHRTPPRRWLCCSS